MTRTAMGMLCLGILSSMLGCEDGERRPDDDDEGGSAPYAAAGVGGAAAGAGGFGGAGAGPSTSSAGGSLGFGSPEVLATDLNLPTSVGIDGTHVYWSETGTWQPNYLYDGRIVRMPKEGGEPVTLASDREFPTGVHADGAFAYWIDEGDASYLNPQHPGRVSKVPVSGGTTIELASGNSYRRMRMDATHAYFTTSWEAFRVPKAGGQAALVVGNQDALRDLAIDESFVYWSRKPINQTAGTIQKVGLAGGATTLVADATSPGAVAVGDDTIFWVEEGSKLMAKPLSGGTPALLASGSGIVQLLVDGSYLYWADCAGGAVVAIPLGGGDPIAVATGLGCAMGLAVDATHLYWVDRGEQFTYPPPQQHAGQIMRATKGS